MIKITKPDPLPAWFNQTYKSIIPVLQNFVEISSSEFVIMTKSCCCSFLDSLDSIDCVRTKVLNAFFYVEFLPELSVSIEEVQVTKLFWV